MTTVEPEPAAAIVVQGLVKRFAAQQTNAIDDISTQIKLGGITGLVGPDGAGKTTLLRIMIGLLKPTAGEVRVYINGTEPTPADSLHELVGYMPQKFGLYEDLTVLENLQLYADLRNVTGQERERSFQRLLKFTDLTDFTDRCAGKLSGGMKQKLGLACTLLGAPKILLLDEPGVGVDPISRRELWRIVRDLVQDGITVVWSTAYLDEAELCDEVRLMTNGKVIASGKPQALMQEMAGRCWQIINIEGNRRAVLQRALREHAIIDGTIQGSNVRLVLREAHVLPAIAAFDAGEQAKLIEVPPRLEDAFISLLGGGPGGDSVLAAVMQEIRQEDNCAGQTVIEARNLTKRFGEFVATNNISFSVARGEIFGLLGPNGAGKSTTFKMECGLLKPTSGEALVMGFDFKSSPSLAKQRLGYMAQKFSLYAQLSVMQNLVFFSGIYGLKGPAQQTKIQQLVDSFAFTPYLETLTEQLPMGFKQRLALACAVMHEPQVLFLDEPTSGVDPVTRREFWSHINGLADKGVTIMVTTHFMDEAEYCDRIALIYRGSMIALGTPDELKQQVTTSVMPNPTMEEVFIELILAADR